MGGLLPRTSSAIAAFCAFDRTLLLSGRPRLPPIPGAALSFSQQPGEPPELSPSPSAPAEDGRDWFVDGKEAARHLKMELGIIENEEGGGSTEQIRDGVESKKTATSDAILESGRAAARELLKSMAGDIEVEEEPQNTESIGDALQAASEQNKQSTRAEITLHDGVLRAAPIGNQSVGATDGGAQGMQGSGILSVASTC